MAPLVEKFPINVNMKSFDITPLLNSPVIIILNDSGTLNQSLPVAKTTETSVAPIPVAKLLNAPYVVVWLSEPTINIPGREKPISGKT
ncbi:hypothetical protein ES703_124332 [subsurface metagenome]